MAFPEKLKFLRTSKNLTQKDFATKIGVSQSSINYWEKGQRIPSIEAAARIANYFSVTIDSLLDKENRLIKQNPINQLSTTYFNEIENIADIHFTTDEYTVNELNQIWQFAHFIKNQRNT